jgi:hypothetical protein
MTRTGQKIQQGFRDQIRQTHCLWPVSSADFTVLESVSLVMEDPDEIVYVPSKHLELVVLGKRILGLVASRIVWF